ncbi:hypothetical protein SNE40_011158 [Patella caerulea]|uniref:Uncharacterized protein n=1 Tax=Patella caerulea TaxID=87958 RepID=A0AAN8JM51_PATCE
MANTQINKYDREIPTPRSYKQVKALSLPNLKLLCLNTSVNIEGIGRDALEVLLCESIGISYTGSKKVPPEAKLPYPVDHCLDKKELEEFEKLTPDYVQSLQGWTKHIENLPDIDIGTVKKYLLATNTPEFSKQIISGIYSAEMLIWTKHGYIVVPIDYDDQYWQVQILPSLTFFFEDYIAVEILTSRVNKGLELYSSSTVESV